MWFWFSVISFVGVLVFSISMLILIVNSYNELPGIRYDNKVTYVGIVLGLILAIGPSLVIFPYNILNEIDRTELVKDHVFEEYGLKEEEIITDVQSLGNNERIYNIKTEHGQIEVYVKDQKIIGSESTLDSNQ